jgi:uncharacterized protein YwqG
MFKKKQPTISEFHDKAGLESAIRNVGVSAPAARELAELGRYSLHLEAANEDSVASGSFSKVGGIPDLPEGVSWPIRPSFATIDEEAPKSFLKRAIHRVLYSKPSDSALSYRNTPQPYSFIAQVSFREMATVQSHGLDLPDNGALYFFYDVLSGGWGFDPTDSIGFRLIYVPDIEHAIRAQSPEFFDEVPTFEEKFVQPVGRFEHCASQGLHFETLSLSDEDKETYEEFDYLVPEPNDRSGHKVMGWPHIIQNPMEEECALVTSGIYCGDAKGYKSPEAERILAQPNEWVLLLQIDSDDAVGMEWGDSGVLYLWIKKSDLRNRNFEDTWLILQCC